LIQIHKPSERANVQGVNDLIIFTLLALTSLTSGMLYHFAGWNILVLTALPIIAIMLVIVLGLAPKNRRQPAVCWRAWPSCGMAFEGISPRDVLHA
jgi:membrane protein YdbS with pleckstrin-like domain